MGTLWRCPKCHGMMVGDSLHERYGGGYCYCEPNKGDPTKCERVEVVEEGPHRRAVLEEAAEKLRAKALHLRGGRHYAANYYAVSRLSHTRRSEWGWN